VRIASARDRAVAAERERTEEPWNSYLAQARASRATGRAGQRFDSLAAIEKAARIHPSVETRNVAIASLALFDARVARSWPRMHSRNATSAFDATLERNACEVANGAISIRRIADQQEIARLTGPGARVEYIYAFSPDGQYLAAKFVGGQTWMWRLADQRPLLKLEGNPRGGLGWSAFSARTGLFAFSLPTGGVDVYRIADLTAENATAPQPWRHWAEPRHPQGLAFSPDGERLAICDVAEGDRAPETREHAGGVQVRDVQTGTQLWNWANAAGVGTAYWNDDGTQLAAASWDRNVHLLDPATGRELRVLPGHRDAVSMAKFNHAGSRVASVGLDGQLLFTDTRSGENLVSFPSAEPTFVFAPDDRHLAVGVDDQTIGLLEIADSTVFTSLRPTNNPGRPTPGR
ncbi:MAG: WD40 repeat domain-containing protein, partial [Chthoniobacterales bacterium]